MATGVVMSEVLAPPEDEVWRPWCVSERSGFEVCEPRGRVGLVQIRANTFLVTNRFRFSDVAVEAMLVDQLRRNGVSADDARRAVDNARTFNPTTENPTDLASIPLFMRWFENPYGVHTLAAIIHDELIVGTANGGALGSDTLSDTFFREMMRSAGVPWLKRWIMWSAVALRSRLAAGSYRFWSVVGWMVLAVIGLTAFGWAVGSSVFSWAHPVDVGQLFALAVILPLLASLLWGRQAGAGLIAAVGALWIVPAAVFGGLGYLTYRALEHLLGRFGLE